MPISTTLVSSSDTTKLLENIENDVGKTPDRWIIPNGRPTIALAVLDSIYSTGNHYTGVKRLVQRYSELRDIEGGNATMDSAADLVRAFDRWGGVEGFVVQTDRRSRTFPSKNAPYKAYAALEAAKVLDRHGINSAPSARKTLADRDTREQSAIARDWLAITSQSSGLTWNYFLMLVGLPGVKADRMIRRYVTAALDANRTVSAKKASRLVEAAADSLGVSYTALDHTIWRFQSNRDYFRST